MEEMKPKGNQSLEGCLGYIFKNKALLKQALTRQSAIEEGVPGAAARSYQSLERIGDAALELAIVRILYKKSQGTLDEGQLHEAAQYLVRNDTVLPEVANKLKLQKKIIKGKGEMADTAKMKADAVEALLGAISLDNESQEQLFQVVEKLWEPHITKALQKAMPASLTKAKQKKAEASPVNNNNNEKPVFPAEDVEVLTPRTQRLFSGLSGNVPIEKLEEALQRAPNPNRRNIGKTGNTPLQMLLSRKKLRQGKEIPRIEMLLKYGALWDVQNRKGQSSDEIAAKKGHDPEIVKRLKLQARK